MSPARLDRTTLRSGVAVGNLLENVLQPDWMQVNLLRATNCAIGPFVGENTSTRPYM